MLKLSCICQQEINSLCWAKFLQISSDWMQKTVEIWKLIEAAEVLKKELLDSGFGDQDADMQQRGSPNEDTKLVGKIIGVLRKKLMRAEKY